MTYAVRFLLALLALGAGVSLAAAAETDAYRLLRLDGTLVKWGAPAFGRPAHVTYAFVDSEMHDDRARNCKAMGPLDGLAVRAGMSVRDIEIQVQAAFGLWESLAGVTFSKTVRMEDADILIGAQMRPRGYAFANVRTRLNIASGDTKGGDRALNQEPRRQGGAATHRDPIAVIEKSAICLNPTRGWKIGRGAGDAYDLKYTFAHEIGHAIGLDHYSQPGQLMFFKYTEAFAGPQAGDAEGARKLYGPPVSAR